MRKYSLAVVLFVNMKKVVINNFGILKECRNKFETLIVKAMLIKRYSPILNKQLTKPGITHTLRTCE